MTADGEPDAVLAPGYRICDCPGKLDFVLHFDFRDRLLAGAKEQAGFCSLYRGPLLFGVDV